MPNPILILSGPVGAGKTTVGRELVTLLPGKVAYIEGDAFWSFLAKGAPGGPTRESFRTVMASMTAAAVPLATAGARVVLDFSIPPGFLSTAQSIVALRQIPLDYVVLRPSEQVCAARAAARDEGRIPDYSRYRNLYLSFDVMESHILSDDTAPALEMAQRIVLGLSDGRFRVPAG